MEVTDVYGSVFINIDVCSQTLEIASSDKIKT